MKPEEKWEKTKKEYNEKLEIVEEISIDGEVEQKELTEEEKQKIKKQMLLLVWLILIIIIGIIMFYIISGLIGKKDNNKTNNNEQQEEKKEPLSDGEIDINNETIQEIDKTFNFNINNPLYEENILKLFNTEKVEVKDLDFQTKMLLITSTDTFKNYMLEKTNLKEYQNKEVSITKEKLEELSKEILGVNITLEHNNFKYCYEIDNKVVYFNVTLQNDKYVFTETTGKKSTIKVHTNLSYAYKISNNIYIQYQTLFEKNGIIYSDSKLTNKLNNDIDDLLKYMSTADSYQFVYKEKYGNDSVKYVLNFIEIGTHSL